MSQDTAKVEAHTEHSPVVDARAKLGHALERLEAIVQARLEEAARAASAAETAAPQQADSEQWQNACRMLEEQLAQLKDENSQLHSELHHTRAQVKELHQRNETLEATRQAATDALDDAIVSVESLLKEA